MTSALDDAFLGSVTDVLSRLVHDKVPFSIDMLGDELAKSPASASTAQPFHRRYPNSDSSPDQMSMSIRLQPLSPSPSGGGASRLAAIEPTGDIDSSADSSSFYVRISLDSVDDIPKAEWATLFANTTYPGNVRGLKFFSTDSLLEHLGLGGVEGAAA